MSVVAIIQARMTSTRLPGKVLAELNGRPMLDFMLDRVMRSERIDSICVATTTNDTDAPVVERCDALGVSVFRGDEADVLGRYAGAAAETKADVVVRLTADCPLMDPQLIDAAIEYFYTADYDYVSNAIELSYPDGLDIEVFTRAALDEAHVNAFLPFQREHVTPYLRTGIYNDIPTGNFRVGHMRAPADFSHLRWTVDTQNDLVRVREIAKAMRPSDSWLDVISLLTRRPTLLNGASTEIPNIELRPAEFKDAVLLFEWVNRPESLAAKLRTEGPVSLESHLEWLNERLTDRDTGIWIASLNNQEVGQVRLQRRIEALDVDIFVDQSYRGRELAVLMLEAARREAAHLWPGTPLRASIKPDNWASRRLFAKAGYGRMLVAPDHLVLYCDPLDLKDRA